MDYEKRYKEALERAKDMLAYKEVRQEDMEYLFPELQESEDEKHPHWMPSPAQPVVSKTETSASEKPTNCAIGTSGHKIEPMIGDWVNFLIDIEGGDTEYDPVNEIYQPMQIVSITAWGNNDGEVESAEGVINGIDQVKPIPLTAEILEKNGFKREHSRGTRDNINYWFVLSYDAPVRFVLFYAQGVFHWFGQLEFKYVHELQHALRLCGIKKEIKL